MNEEVRKQLEELAGNYAEATHGFRPHKYTEAAFMAGAQASWDLATKPSDDDAVALQEHFNAGGISEESFLAGRRGLREAVQAAVEEERKRCAVIVSTFKHEDINAEARLTLARIQTNIIRPSKEGA